MYYLYTVESKEMDGDERGSKRKEKGQKGKGKYWWEKVEKRAEREGKFARKGEHSTLNKWIENWQWKKGTERKLEKIFERFEYHRIKEDPFEF